MNAFFDIRLWKVTLCSYLCLVWKKKPTDFRHNVCIQDTKWLLVHYNNMILQNSISLYLAGGLMLALFTFSTWPEMFSKATSCTPSLVLTTAMVVYIFEILFSVWTIAYNFAPGGEYTRERTHFLIAGVIVTIGLALFSGCIFAEVTWCLPRLHFSYSLVLFSGKNGQSSSMVQKTKLQDTDKLSLKKGK